MLVGSSSVMFIILRWHVCWSATVPLRSTAVTDNASYPKPPYLYLFKTSFLTTFVVDGNGHISSQILGIICDITQFKINIYLWYCLAITVSYLAYEYFINCNDKTLIDNNDLEACGSYDVLSSTCQVLPLWGWVSPSHFRSKEMEGEPLRFILLLFLTVDIHVKLITLSHTNIRNSSVTV